MNKKSIMWIMVGILIAIATPHILDSLIPSVEAGGVEIIECGENDAFLCITIEVHLPQFEVDILNGINGVLAVTEFIDDGVDITIIEIDPELIQLTEGQLKQYFNAIMINTQMNKANSVLRLDTQPSPICSKDVITGEMTGFYSVNSEWFPVANDIRCPTY